jgi:hypothetical protein
MTGLRRLPPGTVFSITMTPVSAAMPARLPMPTPNMTNIKAQQQPRQYPPWRNPRCHAVPTSRPVLRVLGSSNAPPATRLALGARVGVSLKFANEDD